ncbi:MAG: aldehyde dehydrogenase family protein [Bacteroidia bacterium]|nr:aldehyde dehydrogenase family protein [Bacteroidia bacterium]MCC6767892.1 aldehyde dehydrogenase family protein [Bacteroidia bacterium]
MKTKTAEIKAGNGTQVQQTERVKVLKTYKIFIGGQFPRTESGRYYSLALSNGDTVNVCLSSRKDFRNAVVAAREAQEKWAARAAMNRSQILYRIAEMLETRSAQFVAELTDMGQSAIQAKKEVEAAIDRMIYYAGWCDKYNQVFSSVNPVASSHFNFSSTEPMGVVGVIAPEKSALLGLVSVVAPVIASGNTCVVLASNSLPLCAITFAEVLATSDLPAGVVNILTGERKELSSHFSTHMDVNSLYLHTNDNQALIKADQETAMNLKRLRSDATEDWYNEKAASPYRILDFLEVKTTWHPIGI